MDVIRAQLDKLMGVDRNGDVQVKEYTFGSPEVCKNYICGLCSHDLFPNTKKDVGPCPKLHVDKLKAEYEAHRETMPHRVFDFELYFEKYIGKLMAELDLETARAEYKLKTELGGDNQLDQSFTRGIKKLAELTESIDQKIEEADSLGASGLIDESIALLEEVENLKKSKKDLENSIKSSVYPEQAKSAGSEGVNNGLINEKSDNGSDSEATPQQSSTTYSQPKMIACKICSAFLNIFDSDKRLSDHYAGRMHMGCMAIREMDKKLKDRNLASYSNYDSNIIHTLSQSSYNEPDNQQYNNTHTSSNYNNPLHRVYKPRSNDYGGGNNTYGSRSYRGGGGGGGGQRDYNNNSRGYGGGGGNYNRNRSPPPRYN